MNTNIDYWEKILKNPTPAYQELFLSENEYFKAHISKDASVLEVGYGNGRDIETILPITRNIVGIDIEESAVRKTKKRFKDILELQILHGDVLNLSFPEKTFDVVTFMLTFGNLADKKIDALREMKRVMKNEGKIIMSVYSEDSLKERISQYRKINAPIEIEGTIVIFNQTISSEQFSLPEIEHLALEVKMKILSVTKVQNLAYIFELVNR